MRTYGKPWTHMGELFTAVTNNPAPAAALIQTLWHSRRHWQDIALGERVAKEGYRQRAERLEAAVRALHEPYTRLGSQFCSGCEGVTSVTYYPCPTIRAIDATPITRDASKEDA